ncbi:MAG: hypothetical protein IKT17_02315, partial [Lachnospiraceae bacterium]|nr:hypothetical protein [Lachnospiraceae bacterium]
PAPVFEPAAEAEPVAAPAPAPKKKVVKKVVKRVVKKTQPKVPKQEPEEFIKDMPFKMDLSSIEAQFAVEDEYVDDAAIYDEPADGDEATDFVIEI